eukprot:g9.t1
MMCTRPLRLIGVQNASPISWSLDSFRLGFVLGNHSIAIMIFDEKTGSFTREHTLRGHSRMVHTLKFNKSNLLMSAGEDGMILWDVKSGEKLREHRQGQKDFHSDTVECGCWTHEGETFVSGGRDSDLKAWDVDRVSDKKCLETIFGHKAAILDVKFSKETNKLVSCGRDSVIKIWRAQSLSRDWRSRRADDAGIKCGLLGTMSGHRGDVTTMCFGNAGRFLFSGARDNTMIVWDMAKQARLRELHDKRTAAGTAAHNGDIRGITVVPSEIEGSEGFFALTSSLDSKVLLFELGSDVLPTSTDNAEDDSDSSAQQASKNAEGFLKDDKKSDPLDSVESDTILLRQVINNGEGVSFFEYNAKLGAVAASSPLNTVSIFQIRKDVFKSSSDDSEPSGIIPSSKINTSRNPIMELRQQFVGHNRKVTGISMLSGTGSHIVTCSEDYSINVYDTNTMKREMTFNFGSSALTTAVRFVGKSDDPSLFQRDEADCVFVGGTAYGVKGLSLSTVRYGNAIRSGFGLHPLQAAELHTGVRLEGHSGKVRCADIDPTGAILATASEDFTVGLWNLRTKKGTPLVQSGLRPGEMINAQASTLGPTVLSQMHNGHVTAVAFSSMLDGKKCYLSSCSSDHSLIVWKIKYPRMGGLLGASMKPHWRCDSAHMSVVSDVTWGAGPSAQLLFSAGWDHNIGIWRADMGVSSVDGPVRTVWGHTARVSCIETSLDGKRLISAGADMCALVWDLTNGIDGVGVLCKYVTDSSISALTASQDTFVTGEVNGVVRVWPIYNESAKGLSGHFKPATSANGGDFGGDDDGATKSGK